MNKLKYIINRIAGYVYFRTMSIYTLQQTHNKMFGELSNDTNVLKNQSK